MDLLSTGYESHSAYLNLAKTIYTSESSLIVTVYNYIRNLNTPILDSSSFIFPTIEEINIEKSRGLFYIDDTLQLLSSTNYIIYSHFKYVILCKHGKPQIKDVIKDVWTE